MLLLAATATNHDVAASVVASAGAVGAAGVVVCVCACERERVRACACISFVVVANLQTPAV